MNGCPRGALLSAVLLLGAVGCGGSEGAKESRGGPRVGLQGLSTDPDFVVTKVSGPASTTPGSYFETTVEVCNRGGTGSGTDVNVYFSDDDVITSTDFWAGSLYVGYLEPGQCQSQSAWMPASVPTEGAWHLGAYADPYNSQFEGDEGNNGLAGPRMGIGYGPDFAVTAVKGPASAENGQSITVQVTVCNRGTQSGSTDVEVYLSADETITPNVPPGVSEDSFVGSTFVDWLMPGQCGTASVNGGAYLQAPATEGPYFVGAVADPHENQPELIEDNNALAGYRMGVGHRPDFVVTSVKGPVSAEMSQFLNAQVMVCNRGTQSGATDVDVYLSADETITPNVPPNPPEDSYVGSGYSDWLMPGQCSTVSVSGNINLPPPGFEGPYFVGAVADPHESQPELIEDNNSLVGFRMGVGHRPDLVVTAVKGPVSAQVGQSITAQVTVCNQGTQAGYGDVEVYLSADESIHANVPPGPSEDFLLGSGYADYLYPGQCTTVPVSGSVYPPPPGAQGPYFVGAVVDPYGNQPELIEDNNALAGYRMGVGNRADFVVTSVKGPASVESGQPITAQVTVCSQGTQPDSTDVEVYLSADELIRSNVAPNPPEDSFVGSAYVGYLFPGQCATVPVNGSAYPPPPGAQGPYFLGAVVDPYGNQPELIEDNNALAGYRMGIGRAPDFVITAVKGPASATPGQFITEQVTVCNQGTYSNAVDVDVYLSADDIIRSNVPPNPPEDFYLGTASTNVLSPGQCGTVPVSGNAYPPPPGMQGPYFVGAVVDPYGLKPELIEDNNTLVGYRMGLGNRPDFVVTSVKGPASATSGQPITTQVTVCNRGTQADSTDIEVYLSADDVIRAYAFPNPPEDSIVGVASTGYLFPDQCSTVPVSGYANLPPPGTQGPYFVGAVVNPYGYQQELIADNNTLAGYRMGVGNRSDFVVTRVTGPASATNGQSITAQVTVCNQGTQADSTDVEVYLSSDDVIHGMQQPYPSEDAFVGSAPVSYLFPGQCTTVPVTGYANAPHPGTQGAYFVGAVVDPYGNRLELIEDNNTLAGYRMGVGSRSDFIITGVTGPTSATPGQAITVQVTVCNQGTQPDSTNVEVYLSTDEFIRANVPPAPPEDSFVGSAPVGTLYPGQCATVPVSGNAYAPPPGDPGPYFVGAVVDPYNSSQELIEDNNTLAGYRMGVGSRADFVVTSVTGPYSAQNGQAISTQVTVCNQGTKTDSTDVQVFLSADEVIRANVPSGPAEDSLVGSAFVGILYPGQCTTVPVSGNAYTPPPGDQGPYFVGAVVDPNGYQPELIEDNNALAGYRMGVGNRADFVVTSVTGPYSVQPGVAFSVSVGICNRGQTSDTTDVDLYLSADTDVRGPTPSAPGDVYLGTVTGVSLAAGGCTTRTLSVAAPSVPEGAWYLGGVADPYNSRPELIEDNNTQAGSIIGVGNRADFVVTGVTGPSSVQPGATFTASVTVCNRGQLSDTTDVDLYLSADTNVRVPTPPGASEDFYLGTVTGVSLAAGGCTTRSLSVTAPSVPEGAWYLGGVADPYNSRPELIENNNAKAGNVIGVGTRPDFVLTAVTGPSSVRIGAAFTASVTVCNRGQASGMTDVDLYFSADSNIRVPTPPAPPEDFYLGTLSGVSLGVGACSTRSLVVYANAPSTGSYYLGGVADPFNSRVELIEDNNTKAGIFMTLTP